VAIGIPAANAILTSALAGTVHVSLHNDDPGGTGASSVGDRSPATFTVANGQASNAAAITFAPPPGTYTHAGLWVEGQWWGACAFEEPVVVGEDRVLEIPAGSLRVGREQQQGDLFALPPERDGFWLPGLMAVGGIPKDDDPVRPAQVYLPNGDPYDGYSVDPALGDGNSDATSAIQSALNAAGSGATENSRRVVVLPPGDFAISTPLEIPSYVTLRGQGWRGINRTRLIGNTGMMVVQLGRRWVKWTQAVPLAADVEHGSYTVEVESNPGYQVGELVAINQLVDTERVGSWWNPINQPDPDGPSRGWFTRQNRPTGQMLEIAAINGNVLTFTRPIRLNYYVSNEARIERLAYDEGSTVRPPWRWMGLEDVHITGGTGGHGNVTFTGSSYSWAKNIESRDTDGPNVGFASSYRCELRDSVIHSTVQPNPGGGGYALDWNFYASDNLIENCISWNFNKVITARGSGGGNVCAYCYMQDGYGAGYPTQPEVGISAAHFATPHHELLEGNESWNISGDGYWGNSIYLTFLRNFATGRRRNAVGILSDAIQRRFVEVPEWQLWSTYIGNVLGFQGMDPSPQSGFTYDAGSGNPWQWDPVPVWAIGVQHNAGLQGQDDQVVATCLRQGNFDWVTEEQRWHGEGSDPALAIPNSLYLDSKPSFFGSNPWPWVDPTTGQVHTLPAKELFNELLESGHFDED